MASRVRRATPPRVRPAGDESDAAASGCCEDLRHAGLVAEDGAPRELRRRVDGEHRDAVAGAERVQPEGFDEGGLADPRRSRDPDAKGAGRGAQRCEQTEGRGAVGGARGLGEGDRLREGPDLAGPHARGEGGGVRRRPCAALLHLVNRTGPPPHRGSPAPAPPAPRRSTDRAERSTCESRSDRPRKAVEFVGTLAGVRGGASARLVLVDARRQIALKALPRNGEGRQIRESSLPSTGPPCQKLFTEASGVREFQSNSTSIELFLARGAGTFPARVAFRSRHRASNQ